MSFNTTAYSERVHISFFGMRNAGKSSLVNAVTSQEVSLVSDVKGTTTDPVKKAMELLPIGPVVIIDTPGYDDEGDLGSLRIKKTKEILRKTDLAVLVIDATVGMSEKDNELIALFNDHKIPYITVYNKSDLASQNNDNALYVSAKSRCNIDELKNIIAKSAAGLKKEKPVIDDLIEEGDTVILVTPVDESAPKGRLILPQQITLRNILDNNCCAVVCKETELEKMLKALSVKPKLVITDSKVFSFVNDIVPEDILLTSFSIIFARYKGDLERLVEGAAALKNLSDSDKVLISEGCTHHRQCNDIGTVKLPGWINSFTGKNISFSFTSGGDFPGNIGDYKLVVHCGACMLGDKEMTSRIDECKKAGVPMVNYGIAIAMMHGILERSLEVFPEAQQIIRELTQLH